MLTNKNKSFGSDFSSLTRKAQRYLDRILSSPSLEKKELTPKRKIKLRENTYSIF